MQRAIKYCLLVASALFLSSCFIPEKFSSEFNFKEDGSFSYKYDGTMTHALIAAEKAQTGKISEKTQKSIPSLIQQMQKNPDVKEAKHVGEAKFTALIQGERNTAKLFSLMDFIKVMKDTDGAIKVFSPPIKEKNKQELVKLGIKIDGTLKINLPKNVEVLENNATSTPSLGGLIGTYTWKINSENPIILKFKYKDK